jgi:NADH-quinone oxidoreductase subunit G
VHRGRRATFPPGDAREDWAILRALSDVLGVRLPYDNRGQLLEALGADVTHFASLNTAPVHTDTAVATWEGVGQPGPLNSAHLVHFVRDFYLTNPIARASQTMAECSREFVTGAGLAAAE